MVLKYSTYLAGLSIGGWLTVRIFTFPNSVFNLVISFWSNIFLPLISSMCVSNLCKMKKKDCLNHFFKLNVCGSTCTAQVKQYCTSLSLTVLIKRTYFITLTFYKPLQPLVVNVVFWFNCFTLKWKQEKLVIAFEHFVLLGVIHKWRHPRGGGRGVQKMWIWGDVTSS